MDTPIATKMLFELAAMPAGEAGQWIREHIDPLWGLSGPGAIDWVVTVAGNLSRRERFTGDIIVTATDEKAAKKLAMSVIDNEDRKNQIEWRGSNPFDDEWDDEDWQVERCKPKGQPLGDMVKEMAA